MSVIAFADNLKRFRITKGISKSELARRIGVTDATVHKWETARISPRMGKIEMIAKILNVTVDDLLFDVPTEQPVSQNEVFSRMFAALLNQTKYSESKLAKKLGVHRSTIMSWRSGFVFPNIHQLKEIAEIFNVNPLVFIYEDYKEKSKESNHFVYKQNSAHLPLYDAIPAGKSLEMLESIGNIEVPLGIANQYPEAFFLEMSGDSMNKVIPDGAYVLINPCIEVSNGEIAAVVADGFDATLRRFYKLMKSVVLEPDSYNPEHSSKMYDLNKVDSAIIHIVGKVVWFMHPLNIK